jgi:outer membrane receptor protein involved in Fe transport
MLDFGGFALPTDFDFERTRVGGFTEIDGLIANDTTMTGGVRVDDYDDGFTRATARIGLLHTTANALQWRVNAGTGFKPPSFYALAHPLVGNPDLRPERATSFDAGVRGGLANDRGMWDLTVFDARFRDGVDFDPGPPPQLVNRTEIRTRGVELGVRFRATEQWLVQAAVSNSTARTEPDGERLRLRPRWRGTVKVAWLPTDDLQITGAVEHVGSLPDTSIPTADVTLNAWTRVDLGASWQVRTSGEVFLSVDNVLDAEYEEAVGFPSPGRRFRLGLRTAF